MMLTKNPQTCLLIVFSKGTFPEVSAFPPLQLPLGLSALPSDKHSLTVLPFFLPPRLLFALGAARVNLPWNRMIATHRLQHTACRRSPSATLRSVRLLPRPPCHFAIKPRSSIVQCHMKILSPPL